MRTRNGWLPEFIKSTFAIVTVYTTMDNADLAKLIVAPGKLLPKFNPRITFYSATVGSNVCEVKLTALTSDSGASYSIKVCGITLYHIGADYYYYYLLLRAGWRWKQSDKVS